MEKCILKTKYTIGEIPHSEHPTPQAMRKDWLCLNGKWKFQKLDKQGKTAFDGEILVPFSPECVHSGVPTSFQLFTGEKLVYTRKFDLSNSLLKGITLLHFGAVDSECEVFVNGERVGGHRGGFTAFTLDITKFAWEGENEIKVLCMDEGTRNGGARGKQSDTPGQIWYTAQSGIWQTVWIESMPSARIQDFKITPNNDLKSVLLDNLGDIPTTVRVFDNDNLIIEQTAVDSAELFYDFIVWSPENPKLYTLILQNQAGDEVQSYFAVRTFGKGIDAQGKARLLLNGKPYFFNGLLDQGYWSDGLLTYPSDEAVIEELGRVKAMGFNTLRKHIKIEPMRWYYHCDRLGIVVWQDFVNGGGKYNPFHIAIFPFLGAKHKDDDYKYFARQDEVARQEFLTSVEETIAQLYNCPCVGVWVPFNEGWGQFDSAFVTQMVRDLDDTRIIDSVSGWHDQGVDKTELKSLHTYFTPLKVPKDKRPVVLSEFGGYSMQVKGHVFNPDKQFGYKKYKTQEKLCDAIEKLYCKKLLPLIKKGLCGCIYTQVSDVEEETNGLFTYDREVIKIPVERMYQINKKIQAEVDACFKEEKI